MARELYLAEIQSLRMCLERSLFIIVDDDIKRRQTQRIDLETFQNAVARQIPRDKRPPLMCEMLRAIDLVKSLESGAFQPSRYDDKGEDSCEQDV